MRRLRFTLVELMVVITIITALAALLFPSLRAAREQAKKLKCLSNQRQCGIGTIMYVGDFEYFPQCQGESGFKLPGTTSYWPSFVYPYCGAQPLKVGGGANVNNIFKCPALDDQWINKNVPASSVNLNLNFNAFLTWLNNARPKANVAKKPSVTLMFTDLVKDADVDGVRDAGGNSNGVNYFLDYTYNYSALNHDIGGFRGCCVMVDGHGASYKWKDPQWDNRRP